LNQKHPALGIGFALAAAILFGLNASTTKVIMASGISAELVVFIRALSTAIFALVWALATNPARLRVPLRKIPILIFMGIVGVGMLQWTYSIAVSLLPIGIALLIEYTAVLIVPVVALILFKEKVRPQIWLGAVMVIAGLAVVAQIWSGSLNPTGVFFGFAAARSLTVFFLLGERIQRWLPTNVTMFYGMTVAAIFFAPFAGIFEFDWGSVGESIQLSGNLAPGTVPLWIALIWLGTIGAFIPMACSYLALRHLSATVVGIIATSETVLAFLFAYLWLNEVISWSQAMGGLVVIAGILVAQTARKAKSNQESETVLLN
jgi:drug/metabolite transporter (DMT)-like permease